MKYLKSTTIINNFKWLLCYFVPLVTSCASLGSKTLFLEKDTTIKQPTTILLAHPTFVNCLGKPDENYIFFKKLLDLELTPYDISLEQDSADYPEFDNIGKIITSLDYTTLNGEFLLFTKITRITAMEQTRDYKIEYKLVSTSDNKLKFHSKYNTTAGATVVVFPGIKNFPTEDEMMAIAIRSGLYEFKKNLINKP